MDKELIAKFLYDNFNTISRGSWEELPEFGDTRQWWLRKADALIKEAGYKSPEEIAEAVKVERDRVIAIHSKPYPD